MSITVVPTMPINLKSIPVVPTTMPINIKNSWCKALRSGDYIQGKYNLKTIVATDGSSTFCCLGVLQHCIDGDVEMKNNQSSKSFPSIKWLEEHNIDANQIHPGTVDGNMLFNYRGEFVSASDLNDTYEVPFSKIADIIEEQVIGI